MSVLQRIERSRLAIAVCIALVASIVLWRGVQPGTRWGVNRYAAHLVQQTELADDGRAVSAVRKLAALGAAGDLGLAQALDARQARVADAAEEELLAHIEQWQVALDGGAADSRSSIPGRAVALAATLAEHVDHFGPRAQGTAARIAMRLLRLGGEDFAAADWSQLIAGCDHVIETADMPSPRSILAAGAVPSARETPDREALSLEQIAALPSSPPPLDRTAEVVDGIEPLPDKARNRHGRPPTPWAEHSRQAESAPAGGNITPTYRAEWKPPDARYGAADPLAIQARAVPVRSEPTAEAVRRARATIDRLTLRRLMQRLHDPDPAVAKAAEEALRERGLSTVEIEVARRLTSPDVRDRERLVDDLPHTRGIDARPWLFWLAVDDNANVRLAAMTLLATTSDPAVLDRVRKLAAGDRDRRIVALSERLAVLE